MTTTNKKNYLTPKVSVVKFTVESGFAGSKVLAPNPTAGTDGRAQYTETSDDNFMSDFQFINQ